jgi:hypothetical protein
MTRRIQFGAMSLAAVTVITGLVLIGSAHDASAANVLTNSTFNAATAGNGVQPWADVASATSSFSALGNPGGSLQLQNTSAGVALVESECVSTSAGLYSLTGDFLGDVNNGGGNNAHLRLLQYTDASCVTLDGAATVDSSPVVAGTVTVWTPMTATGISISAGHPSARVELVLTGDLTGLNIGNFDNVILDGVPSTATPTNTPTNTPTPTDTPVPPTSTPTNTPAPATNTPTDTPVPPTNTPTNTPGPATDTPTNTPVPPTNTPGLTDTPTQTNTPGPTNTPTNTPTVTNTAVPTATNTLVPPTSTPTNTAVPPTATEAAVTSPPPAGAPPESVIEPSNAGDVAGAGDVALPDAGSGDGTRGSNRTIALLMAIASGAAGVSIFAAAARRKRTEK